MLSAVIGCCLWRGVAWVPLCSVLKKATPGKESQTEKGDESEIYSWEIAYICLYATSLSLLACVSTGCHSTALNCTHSGTQNLAHPTNSDTHARTVRMHNTDLRGEETTSWGWMGDTKCVWQCLPLMYDCVRCFVVVCLLSVHESH